jgi:hypothetical protein
MKIEGTQKNLKQLLEIKNELTQKNREGSVHAKKVTFIFKSKKRGTLEKRSIRV